MFRQKIKSLKLRVVSGDFREASKLHLRIPSINSSSDTPSEGHTTSQLGLKLTGSEYGIREYNPYIIPVTFRYTVQLRTESRPRTRDLRVKGLGSGDLGFIGLRV